ncbi:MAG: class I SAM-dependent methyltransferase [Phycisphaerae bacterium]|jgi:SAM-dependent methyltransferase
MTTPADEPFGERYFGETYGVNHLPRFGQAWWSVRLYAGIADRWLKRTGGRRVLDVGCGYGFLLAALERRYETVGVDVSAHAVERCAQTTPRSQCLVADLNEELPAALAPETFDLVLARYIFEHLRDPEAVLRRCARLLRPGGVLFYAVPNTESLGARWKGPAWYALQDPTHCSLLPPAQWLRLTRAAGLVVVREFADGYWDLPYVSWLPRWVQFPIFMGPSVLTCLLAREVLPARFGENVMVIARKGTRPEPVR